jgi:ribosome-associated protein
MDIRKLQRAIVDGLEDVKAQDILVFNTEHLSPLFERVIIASGTSNRQTKALASGVRDAVRKAGFPVLATEGADNGEWIIVDCGAAVAHIMQPGIRDYYRLEEIWGGKPVKMKIGGDGPRGLVKASEPDDDDEAPAMAPDRKAAAKKSAAKKTVAKRPVPAKKVVAKTAVQRTTSDRPAAKRAAAAEAELRKTAARKTAAKKTAAGKTVAGKTVAGKAAAGKTPARKTAAPVATKVRTIVVKPPARKTVVGKPVAGKTAAAKPAARGAAAPRAGAKPAARPAAKPAAKAGPKRG